MAVYTVHLPMELEFPYLRVQDSPWAILSLGTEGAGKTSIIWYLVFT